VKAGLAQRAQAAFQNQAGLGVSHTHHNRRRTHGPRSRAAAQIESELVRRGCRHRQISPSKFSIFLGETKEL
jgi:hypothetical protein